MVVACPLHGHWVSKPSLLYMDILSLVCKAMNVQPECCLLYFKLLATCQAVTTTSTLHILARGALVGKYPDDRYSGYESIDFNTDMDIFIIVTLDIQSLDKLRRLI